MRLHSRFGHVAARFFRARSRRAAAALVAAIAATACLPASLAAQAILGRWEVRNQMGGTTTLVLTDAGGGQLGGTFSGNGNSFVVAGQMQGDDGSGTISGRGMSLYFQATAKGGALLLVLAEPGPGGAPNLATAQQVLLTKVVEAGGGTTGAAGGGRTSGAPGSASAGAAAPSAGASATSGSATSGSTGGGATPAPRTAGGATDADRQMIRLLTANAWCAFSYSGSQTYSGSSGTTRTERVVLSPDGTARSGAQSEFSGSGEAGSATTSRAGGQTGYWRFERGLLAFSADGVTWQPAAFKMTFNSNGYPIPVVNGKEYMVCR
ncbi:MAG: hypothetical protein HY275_05155 [Gemmatimonadetes bacterium]|nr:hypothetical protein [Gemmatimonadota bacterium]